MGPRRSLCLFAECGEADGFDAIGDGVSFVAGRELRQPTEHELGQSPGGSSVHFWNGVTELQGEACPRMGLLEPATRIKPPSANDV